MGGFILANSDQSVHTRFSGSEVNNAQFRVGTVVDCNIPAYTVDVQLHGHENVFNVPILNTQGATLANDTQWLVKLRGAQVALIMIGSQYYVLGTLNLPGIAVDSTTTTPIVDSTTAIGDQQYIDGSVKNYQNYRAVDFCDSDKVIKTSNGTTLALLNSGLATLKASPMAQFILGRYKDFFKLIARVGSFYSDFGEVHVTHTPEGRVGIHTKGGASFSEETHPSKEKWTVQTWVGDCPEYISSRFFIKVNNVALSQEVTLMFSINGDLSVAATHDHNITIGNDETTTIGGKQTTSAGGAITITSGSEVSIHAPVIKLNC